MQYIKKNWSALLYVFPAAGFITVFFISSVIYTLYLSFTEWDALKPPKWIGLENYREIFLEPTYLTSLFNTIIWVVLSLIIPVGLGLLLSVWLQNMRGQTILKNIFYLPYAISLTVVGIIFAFLLSKTGINYLLTSIGLESWTKDWLNTPPYHTMWMIAATVWQGAGTNMMLFLVGLGALPREPFESAQMDGAGPFRMFRSITLPLLKPVTIVVVGMTLVNSFKIFDIIWVMTMGGPYRSSETLAVTVVRESFMLFHFGQGAAIAIVLTVATLGATWFYLRRTIGGLD